MSSGGSSAPVTTQTQNSAPWSGAQPYLSDMYLRAQTMATTNQGYQPYAGPVQAPLDPTLGQGLNWQGAVAQGLETAGNPYIQTPLSQGQGVISTSGITPGIAGALGIIGDVATQAQGQQNPYLQQILDTQNRRISDQINASMSGAGRYGSANYQDVMARGMAEAEAPLLQQDYEARQNRALQAGGSIADIYGRGLQQAGQYSQLMPTLEQAYFLPGQMQQDVGQYLQGRAQQDLAGQIALYNAQQAYPWQQLQREAAILAGAGQLGGSQVSTSSTSVPLTQRLLGGALAGGAVGSIFPGIGTGVGALGGGLLGLL